MSSQILVGVGVLTYASCSPDVHWPLEVHVPLHTSRCGATQAVEAFLQSSGALPVNVKFMLEGQEEVGSWGLEATLVKTKELFAADYAVR